MSRRSLEDAIKDAGSAVEMLRNSQIGAWPTRSRAEFTNWRDEQRAWRETCVLFDQSHHMTDLDVEGPGRAQAASPTSASTASRTSRSTGRSSSSPCSTTATSSATPSCSISPKNSFKLVGRPPAANWVQFHAETGGYNVKRRARRTHRAARPIRRRKTYRYQVQGPNAMKIMEKVNGGPLPDLEVLRHGRDHDRRPARCARCATAWRASPAGNSSGRGKTARPCATPSSRPARSSACARSARRAYSTNALESGWIPSPLPAIYTGDKMKAYRQWLPATSYEATASLGGSFYSDNIEDYYLTPCDLGYGPFVKFDHDFIGRAALEKMAAASRAPEGHAGLERRRRRARVQLAVRDGRHPESTSTCRSPTTATLPYDKIAQRRQDRRPLDLHRLQLQRARVAVAGMVDTELSEPGTRSR